MVSFDPPELRQQWFAAINALEDIMSVHGDGLFWRAGSEPEEYRDCVITPETEFDCSLYSTHEDGLTATVAQVLAWADMLNRFKLKKRRSLRMDGETLVYVEGVGAEEHSLACSVGAGKMRLAQEIKIDGGRFVASLVCGFTPFALFIEKEGENDRDYISSYHHSTAYVRVQHPKEAKDETIDAVANSFLFEIASAGGGYFRIASYPSNNDIQVYDDDAQARAKVKLRPLNVGRGLADVHDLFLAGCSANPAEYALIHFVKVIEYVSATVVRMSRHDAMRRRLATKAALAPDAAFLDGLAGLLEEQRVFSKDSEAIKLTVQTCCDPVTLAADAPPFLTQLRKLRYSDEVKLRKAATDELSACLSATRNQLSHAKANYSLTGSECPANELGELTACARAAAEQVIRWYSALPEHARVS